MSMKTYIATSNFNISRDDTKTLSFEVGDKVNFDGQTVQLISRQGQVGESLPLPKLSVAIKANWLTPSANPVAYKRPSANIPLRGATPEKAGTISTGITQASEEERVVSSVQQRQNRLAALPEDSQVPSRPVQANTSMEVVSADTNESQKVLSTAFKTATDSKSDLGRMSSQDLRKVVAMAEAPHQDMAGTVPSAIENPNVRHAEGITFRNENVSSKAAFGTTETQAAGQPDLPVEAEAGRVVSTIHATREERLGKHNLAPRVPQPEPAFEIEFPEVPELVDPDPVEIAADDTLDPKTKEGRYEVARIIHPELPDWDFTAHWTKKMALLKDEHTDDLTRRAVYASESEAIKRRMLVELNLDV